MKLVEVVAVGIRLIGILMIFLVLRDTPQLIATLKSATVESGSSDTAKYMFVWLLLSVLALLLIKFPLTFAKLLVSETESGAVIIEKDGEAIQVAGFILVGIYILTWAIPDLFHNAMLLWHYNKYYPNQPDLISEVVISELITLLEIAIGVLLAIKSNGVVSLVRRLRG